MSQKEDGPTLKVWHFVVSQIVLFITLLGFIGGFGSWTISQLQSNFYPSSKGEQLEKTMDRLNTNIEEQNRILTGIRVYIAKNVKGVSEGFN